MEDITALVRILPIDSSGLEYGETRSILRVRKNFHTGNSNGEGLLGTLIRAHKPIRRILRHGPEEFAVQKSDTVGANEIEI